MAKTNDQNSNFLTTYVKKQKSWGDLSVRTETQHEMDFTAKLSNSQTVQNEQCSFCYKGE